jgi:hypothetical protein
VSENLARYHNPNPQGSLCDTSLNCVTMLRSPLVQTISYFFFFSSQHAMGDSAVRMPFNPYADVALRNLKPTVFFGITDYWDASICLFHTVVGW